MSENSKASCSTGGCGCFRWSAKDVVFLLIIVASVIVIMNVRGNSAPAQTPSVFAQNMSFTDAASKSAVSNKPVLVYATASWCGPCQAFKRGALSDPKVESTILDRTLPVYLDIDENPEVAGMLGVNSVPRMILIQGDQIVAARVGVMSAAQTIAFIEEHTSPALASTGN